MANEIEIVGASESTRTDENPSTLPLTIKEKVKVLEMFKNNIPAVDINILESNNQMRCVLMFYAIDIFKQLASEKFFVVPGMLSMEYTIRVQVQRDRRNNPIHVPHVSVSFPFEDMFFNTRYIHSFTEVAPGTQKYADFYAQAEKALENIAAKESGIALPQQKKIVLATG